MVTVKPSVSLEIELSQRAPVEPKTLDRNQKQPWYSQHKVATLVATAVANVIRWCSKMVGSWLKRGNSKSAVTSASRSNFCYAAPEAELTRIRKEQPACEKFNAELDKVYAQLVKKGVNWDSLLTVIRSRPDV